MHTIFKTSFFPPRIHRREGLSIVTTSQARDGNLNAMPPGSRANAIPKPARHINEKKITAAREGCDAGFRHENKEYISRNQVEVVIWT